MRFVTPDNLKHPARLALAAALATITWLALANNPPLTGAFAISDKLNHVFAFFVLALLTDNGFPVGRRWLQCLLLAFYGLFLETMQYQTGYRYFEVSDLAADVFGLCLYLPLHGQVSRKLTTD